MASPESPGTVQACNYFCPTGNEADLPGVALTAVALRNPLRQGAGVFDDLTKLYVWPDGTVSADYNGTGTQEAAYRYGGALLAAEVGPGGGATASGGQRLINALGVLVARAQRGFYPFALPIIVDESAEIQIPGLTAAPQTVGYNAQSVRDIFQASKTPDPEILAVARQVQGRVVTYDRGRDLGGGFGKTAILLNPKRPTTIVSALRQVYEAVGLG